MKHILCFGDSLTWGINLTTQTRLAFARRYTGILQQKLGTNYRMVKEDLKV